MSPVPALFVIVLLIGYGAPIVFAAAAAVVYLLLLAGNTAQEARQ